MAYHAPDQYAMSAGGKLRHWRFGPVSDWQLRKRDPISVLINGVTLHSLYFHAVSAGQVVIQRRWDCINGWNK